jgi:flagellar basal body P-ring formation protein FlgA
MKHMAAAFAAMVLTASAHAQQASIHLRAQAEPRAAHYTLGDVAEIRSADAALAQALAAIEIGLTPRPGAEQSLSRAALASRLERVAPQWRGRLQWQGATAVVLRAHAEALDAPALQRLAERTLLDALRQRGLRAEVRAVAPLGELRLPASGARQVGARLPEHWAPARRMPVWLDVAIDGRAWRSVPVWFEVKAEQQVWLARESLPAGTALQAGDVQSAWFDITALATPALPASTPLDGLRLRRAVDAGRPLGAVAVEPRPAVLRNQPVDVKLELGAIRLQTAGIALADARLGEKVKVRSPAGHEPFVARVVAEGTVHVEAR